MDHKMFEVLFFVAACYANPKHNYKRQALDTAGWKSCLKDVNVFVDAVPKTKSKSVDGPNDSTTTTTTTITTTVKRFIIFNTVQHWKAAKSSCESIGARLAEPKTLKQANFLGSLIPNDEYWIGGTCSGCKAVGEDKWKWVSGGKISLSNEMWGLYYKKQLPHDTDNDALLLALARNAASGNKLTFVNYRETNSFKYICEMA